jgi:rhodanese-related sulfurtransferase
MKWMQFLTPAKSINFEETRDYISQHSGEDITILDVRQPSEYQESHIPGAILIPLPQLPDRLDELDPQKPTLVY